MIRRGGLNGLRKLSAELSCIASITIRVPAGFVVQSEDKIYRAAPFGLPLSHEALKQRQFTPETATFFFEEPAFWSRSAHTIGYVMRAQFGGKFQAPPASISDMYAVKVRARTKAATLTVEGK